MARLYKRGRVWWTWGYYADGERWTCSTGCHDRGAADRKATLLERARASVDRAEATPLPIERAVMDVIAAREREQKSPGTIAVYTRCGGHLCRLLGGDLDVHDLTLAHLEGYIDRRRKEGARDDGTGGTMRSTIHLELRTLKSALLYAKRHRRYRGEIVDIWPAEALKNAYVPHERYLTREQFIALRDALPHDRGEYLVAYVFTGARRREVWSITPEDVSLPRNTIRIRGTKTGDADRVVPITAELLPIVKRRLSGLAPGSPLFPPWGEWRVLDNACKRTGMEGVSPNDLRRTFCSWLALAGTPLMMTVRLMGHRSARMVESVYARFGADDLQAAMAKMPDTRKP